MKRHASLTPGSGLFGTALATATILGCSVVPQTTQASPRPDIVTSGIFVSMLTPTTTSTDGTKQLEISAFYQAATSTGGVTQFELYVDGQREAVQKLDAPDMRGVVTFRLAPDSLSVGQHQFVVTVSASDAEVSSAKTDLTIDQPVVQQTLTAPDGSDTAATDISAPDVAITSPSAQATVEGIVDIKVDAHDASGNPPYVSLFIDHSFKTLRNFPPFDFAWDTTRVQNGLHTIEVWGYNDDQAVGHAEPLTVFVNNPSGRTTVREDLLDTVPQKVLIDTVDAAAKPERRRRAVATAKASARSLAKDNALGIVEPVRLASSQASDIVSGSLSEQTMLMAPFLQEEDTAAPAPRKRGIAIATPTLANGSPAGINIGEEELAVPDIARLPSLSEDAELVQPVIEEKPTIELSSFKAVSVNGIHVASPISRPDLAIASDIAVPIALVRSDDEAGTEDEADAMLETPEISVSQPVLMKTPDVEQKPKAHAALVTTQIDSDNTQIGITEIAAVDSSSSLFVPSAGLQAPSVTSRNTTASAQQRLRPTVNVSTRAVLAFSKVAPVGKTQMASATVDASQLFAPTSSLQTPVVALKQIGLKQAIQPVQPQVQVLGQSSAGFPVKKIIGSQAAYQVVMNDHIVSLQQPLQDHASMLYAPFRQIFESEGGIMSWNGSLHQVHALNGNHDIILNIGSKKATVDNQPFTLTASPYIAVGHTMIPLNFVPIALNATVSFDPASGHLVINSND